MKRRLVVAGVVLTLLASIAFAVRNSGRRFDPDDYVRERDRAQLLREEYLKRCPNSEKTMRECDEIATQAEGQRREGDVPSARHTLLTAPKECWCSLTLRDEIEPSVKAIREFEKEHGWRWGPFGRLLARTP